MKLIVEAMVCGISKVATLQISHHTSESCICTGDRSMRSHEASHNDTVHAAQKKLINEQIAFQAQVLQEKKDPFGPSPLPYLKALGAPPKRVALVSFTLTPNGTRSEFAKGDYFAEGDATKVANCVVENNSLSENPLKS